jgi:hypothetical protein
MGHQCPDTDDRVVDVLGELVAQFGSNVIIALPGMAIGSGEAFQVKDGFDIPNYHAAHVDVQQATHSPPDGSCGLKRDNRVSAYRAPVPVAESKSVAIHGRRYVGPEAGAWGKCRAEHQ